MPAAAALLSTALLASAVGLVSGFNAASGVVPGFSRAPQSSQSFERWLDRDVEYLITAGERQAARGLRTDDDRERFVREFWARRDPTPGTSENEFYDEHYRRLDEADRRFGAGVAGWRTDRGRIYITWGPPDFVETNPAGVRGFVLGAFSEAPELPSEVWTYESLGGRQFGTGRAQIVFVDRGGGDYRLLTDPNDVNLAYVYRLNTAANPLQYTSAAFADPTTGELQTQRAAEERSQVLGPEASKSTASNLFERIQLTADLRRSPAEVLNEIARSQRARGLEGDVQARLFTRRFAIQVGAHVFQVGGDQAYSPVAVFIPGDAVQFARRDRYEADLLVRGEVKEEATGRTVRQFTERLKFRLTEDTYTRGRRHGFSYQKALSLPPGRYRVDIAVKDDASQAIGLGEAAVVVPTAIRGLSMDGPILAERITRLSPAQAAQPFTIGSLDVAPRVGHRFATDETLNAVVHVRGFEQGAAGSRLTADYTILRGDQVVLRTDVMPLDSGARESVILGQGIPLARLEPGDYILQVKVIDHVAGTYAIARAEFQIVSRPEP